MSDQERVVVVAGSGRCGTSLVMQMLAAGGMRTIGQGPSFEDTQWQARCARDSGGAFYAARGAAVKLLPPALQAAIRFQPARRTDWIWLSRDHTQQAHSINKFGRAVVGIPPIPIAKLVKQLEAEATLPQKLTRNHLYRVLTLTFEDLINRPTATAAKVSVFLGGTVPVGAMADCVIPRATTCFPGLLETALLQRYSQLSAGL